MSLALCSHRPAREVASDEDLLRCLGPACLPPELCAGPHHDLMIEGPLPMQNIKLSCLRGDGHQCASNSMTRQQNCVAEAPPPRLARWGRKATWSTCRPRYIYTAVSTAGCRADSQRSMDQE